MENMDNLDDFNEAVRTPGGELDDRLLEEEYLAAEKGKMNILQVAFSFVFSEHLVLHQSYEGNRWYRISCNSICILESLVILPILSLGWYLSWDHFVCSHLRYDDFCNVPAS